MDEGVYIAQIVAQTGLILSSISMKVCGLDNYSICSNNNNNNNNNNDNNNNNNNNNNNLTIKNCDNVENFKKF